MIAFSILPCFRHLTVFTECDTKQFESVTQEIALVIEHTSTIRLSVQLSVFETLGDINKIYYNKGGNLHIKITSSLKMQDFFDSADENNLKICSVKNTDDTQLQVQQDDDTQSQGQYPRSSHIRRLSRGRFERGRHQRGRYRRKSVQEHKYVLVVCLFNAGNNSIQSGAFRVVLGTSLPVQRKPSR